MTENDKPFLLTYPNLENPYGRVVLSNDLVVVQRLVVPAGMWEGVHSHPGNQIFVHIHGGTWSGRLGDEYEYEDILSPDGEVDWLDAIPLDAEHDSGNTGDSDIDIVYVTLKTESPVAPDSGLAPQTFPKLSPELLLDNDRAIAQRITIEPGEWTGVHSRPGNQVYVVVRGGTWAERRAGTQSLPPIAMEAGSAGWLDAVGADKQYEIGNTGDSPIEFVLVTIR